MKYSGAFMAPLLMLCGCTSVTKSVGTGQYPKGSRCEYLVYDEAGALLQKSLLENGRFVSVWEWRHDADGKRHWSQTVKAGEGNLEWYDSSGSNVGWAEVEGGEMVRGGH